MMRLIIGMSKRDCGLVQQVFKHKRMPNGAKKRFRLAPDSKEMAPEIFPLPKIVAYEEEAEKASLQARAAGARGRPRGRRGRQAVRHRPGHP